MQQYFIRLPEAQKNRKLNDLLDALEFNQVVIFVKSVGRASELDRLLRECNFPSITIHGGLAQEERIARYKSFKDFNKRICVATDVLGRGIDIERVNIVINYDMPDSPDSYLHRVGRAGRFGTSGLAITFVATDEDKEMLEKVQARYDSPLLCFVTVTDFVFVDLMLEFRRCRITLILVLICVLETTGGLSLSRCLSSFVEITSEN